MEPILDYSYGVIPVIKEDDRSLFLIVQHAPGHWSFPKGHKEGIESNLEAAKRELWEETGIADCDIKEDIFFTATHIFEQQGKRYEKTNTYYLGFPKNKNTSIPTEWKHEIIQCGWFSYEEAKALINFEPVIKVLDEAVKKLREINL